MREAARHSRRLANPGLRPLRDPRALRDVRGAIVLARIPRVVYGATDPKAGAAGSVLDVLGEPRLNHRPQVEAASWRGGRGAPESFFAARR